MLLMLQLMRQDAGYHVTNLKAYIFAFAITIEPQHQPLILPG